MADEFIGDSIDHGVGDEVDAEYGSLDGGKAVELGFGVDGFDIVELADLSNGFWGEFIYLGG